MVLHAFSYYPFPEIRLEAIDSYVQQIGKILLPPFLCGRIGEVYRGAS